MNINRTLTVMPDGTIKQLNFFSRTEVWSVPGRGNKPIANAIPATAKKLPKKAKDDYCNFCFTKYANTPPEKERLVLVNGKYKVRAQLKPENIFNNRAVFRRVPNLFEIVTIDYWEKNYNYFLSSRNEAWKQKYLSSKTGLEHVLKVINLKLKLSGQSDEEIRNLPESYKLEMANAFFGGGHELIIADRHYKKGAVYDSELCSSGEMTQEEHFEYMKFTIRAIEDIYANNRYVRYITVFQNWLKDAGASFDHLHKQIVALDEWGPTISMEVKSLRKNNHVYNEIVNFHAYSNLVFAENDYAIAYVEIGHRYPTIGIISKSHHTMPYEHTGAELKGFSDVVHACHAAMGSGISCNEEWYYQPRDCLDRMPFRVLIKWRTNTTAGFEGGTKIYINPVSPQNLRDKMVPRLYELRDKRVIKGFKIAEECLLKPNSLEYYKK